MDNTYNHRAERFSQARAYARLSMAESPLFCLPLAVPPAAALLHLRSEWAVTLEHACHATIQLLMCVVLLIHVIIMRLDTFHDQSGATASKVGAARLEGELLA